MLKKSLFIGTFFLLFIGLSDYGYGCHRDADGDGKQDPHRNKPCKDDGDSGNNQTPVVVTFDSWENDEIQSDNGTPYVDGEDVQAIIPDVFDSPGQFVMNLKLGGERNLFIDFGAAVDCNTGDENDNPPFGDCVRDARFDPDSQNNPLLGIVECPFPAGLGVRGTQNGGSDDAFCSALVKAFLAERTAFDLDGNGVMQNIEYILDMETPPPCEVEGCNPVCPGDNCGGPVKKVRSVNMHGEWDINFKVPRPNGNKVTIWYFTFSNIPSGHCDPEMPPEFLSIRALNLIPDVGGALGADTWQIGTFNEAGRDTGRLACLSKAKGGNPDEFVGFFEMSFMYTIVIKPEDSGE